MPFSLKTLYSSGFNTFFQSPSVMASTSFGSVVSAMVQTRRLKEWAGRKNFVQRDRILRRDESRPERDKIGSDDTNAIQG